jgi:hypothetical protein
VLSPTFADRVVDAAFAHNPDAGAERLTLEAERKRLAMESSNLTTAIAAGGNIPELVAALQKRERDLKALDAKLAKPVVVADRDVLKAALELRTADWRNILRGPHVQQARLVLQHLLDLPIRIHNEPKPKWVAAARPEGLMAGLVQSVASPRGHDEGRQWEPATFVAGIAA